MMSPFVVSGDTIGYNSEEPVKIVRRPSTPYWTTMRRKRPSRTELVERKHRLEGEINTLRAELRRRMRLGEDTAAAENRLEIDRTPHDR